MPNLIWAFAGHTYHFVSFVVLLLNYWNCTEQKIKYFLFLSPFVSTLKKALPYKKKKKKKKVHDLEIKKLFFFTKIYISGDFSKLNSGNKNCFEHLSACYDTSRRMTKPTIWPVRRPDKEVIWW